MLRVNILFIVLTFIIIVAVIVLSDSLMTAMLIVSLLTNFLVISAQFRKISKNILDVSVQNWGSHTANTETTSGQDIDQDSGQVASQNSGQDFNQDSNQDPNQNLGYYANQDTNLYGQSYNQWNAHHTGYTSCYDEPQMMVGVSCSERSNSIDASNALIAQKRARDKKCTDGWVTKNANYYKHHFGNELTESEDKPWWGRVEY